MARAGTNHKGGRPKGKLLQKTLDKMKILEAWRDRAAKLSGNLLGAQTLVAMGTHTLMRIDEKVSYRESGKTDKKGNPVKSKYVTKEFTVVTDPKEIERVLNEFEDVDGSGVVDEQYYFITHKEPQNQAIDSILNRTFGRPVETIELGNKDGEPFVIIDS